jgi:hypothetical protein
MQNMFAGASAFNQDVSLWNIEGLVGLSALSGFAANSALSTYHYNALLFAWSKQQVLSGLTLTVAPTKYGGCEVNAGQGILGHMILSALPSPVWKLVDGGMDPCPINGTLSYTPPQSAGSADMVVVTLTLSSLGNVVTSGWDGAGLTYTKLFTQNVSEVVEFVDVNGANTGSVMVVIDWIDESDKKSPEIKSLVYTPAEGPAEVVMVSVVFNEPVQAVSGWVQPIPTILMKNFTSNT